eukprot:CAMPEP_0174911954 /NCGR_PEP_ID=MMETSP0167-20121228/78984_1 /TAXON_ID=38298 /ORGANISM="Rhodella maculata, Strain CCMP736" /LENGTH=77 /DNA_ID=CAMNT_0016156571 /DNA_START=121 /DNA_END=351 /DNA_ORIENTATION=+
MAENRTVNALMLRVKSNAVSKKNQPKVDKGSEGLRLIARLVCAKVEEKGVTSYNDVADELVRAENFSAVRTRTGPGM